MRRITFVSATVAALALAASSAWAGNPHFVGSSIVECDNNTLTVTGKEAGLGNETQVHIVVEATAQCINPGQKHPKAANKEAFSAEGDFPVQNGKANFQLTVTADLQPDCSPPMTILWTDIVVYDDEHNLSKRLGDCSP